MDAGIKMVFQSKPHVVLKVCLQKLSWQTLHETKIIRLEGGGSGDELFLSLNYFLSPLLQRIRKEQFIVSRELPEDIIDCRSRLPVD